MPPTQGNNTFSIGNSPNNTQNLGTPWAVTQLLLPSGAVTLSGSTIRFNANPQAAIGKLSNNAATVINNALQMAGPTRFYTDSGDITLAGQISGGGPFVKDGTGTVVVSGNNIYAGGTMVSKGVLSISNESNLGNAYSPIFLSGGTLLASTSFLTTSGHIFNVFTTGAISVASNSTLTTNSPFVGTGEFDKLGTGTLSMRGLNSMTGDVRIAAGILDATNPAQLGCTINSVILDGGTLRASGNFMTDRPISVSANSAIDVPALDARNNAIFFFASGNLTGAGQLTKIDAGTLLLRGTNNMTGAVRISGGTLDIANQAQLGTQISSVILNGGMLLASGTFSTDRGITLASDSSIKVGGNFILTSSGNLTGSGGLTKNGSGTLLLAGTNSNNGGITVAGGTITFGSANAIGGSGANVLVQTGAIAAANYAIDQSFLGRISSNSTGTVALGVNSGNALDFTGLGNVSLGAATTTNNATYSGTLTPAASGYLLGGGSSKLIVTSNLSGANALTIVQSGKVVLSGTNTYTGGTTINSGGMLYFNGLGALSNSGTITVQKGGAVGINTAINQSFIDHISSNSSGAVALGLDSNSALNFSNLGNVSLGAAGSFTYSGVVTPGSSGYRFGGVPGIYNGSPGTLTVTQNLEGANDVTIASGGLVVFTGTNTYSGNTTIAGGSLNIAANSQLGSGGGPVTMSGGGVLVGAGNITSTRSVTLGIGGGGFASAAANQILTWNGDISGSGGLIKSGSGTLVLGGNNTYSSGTAITGGNVIISADVQFGTAGTPVTLDGGTLQISSNITTTRPFTINSGGGTINTPGSFITPTYRLDLNGNITGVGTLTKIGNGTLALGGDNSNFVGDTYVKEGTLVLTANNSLSPYTRLQVDPSATFNANGFTQTFADLSGSGALNVGAGGLSFKPSGVSTYSGQMQGSGGFTMSGDGTLTLNGTNSYSGATNIQSGMVKLGGAGALPANTPLQLSAGAMLDLNGNPVTVGQLDGAGSVALGGAALTINQTGNTTFTGVMQGTGGFTKQGAGVLVLGGNNTFTGNTTIEAGTVQLGATGALPDGTPLHLSAGAMLDLNGNPVIVGQLAGAGSVALGGAALTINQTGNTTFTGALQGTGGFTKQGTGVLVLGGSNSFSGNATIEAGTVRLGAAGALPTGAPVQLSAGATLDLNGNPVTIGQLAGSGNVTLGGAALTINQTGNTTFAGVLEGTGGLTKQGSGMLTLSGNQTFSGNTSISGGEVKLNGSAPNSAFTLLGGVLSGNATVSTLTVGSGGVIAPGNSPGTLTVSGNSTLVGGGSFQWQINDAAGTAGGSLGWDLLGVSGALAITATSNSKFTITLQTLDAFDASGAAANFLTGANYTFAFVNAGSISGFDATKFAFDTSGIVGLNGTWAVAQAGNSLNLVYTGGLPVPEPSTYAIVAGGTALLFTIWRRRNFRVERT